MRETSAASRQSEEKPALWSKLLIAIFQVPERLLLHTHTRAHTHAHTHLTAFVPSSLCLSQPPISGSDCVQTASAVCAATSGLGREEREDVCGQRKSLFLKERFRSSPKAGEERDRSRVHMRRRSRNELLMQEMSREKPHEGGEHLHLG